MGIHFKVGLKLHSANTALIPQASKLRGSFLDFVEVYVVPGSYKNTIACWKDFDVSYAIHAPHSFHGMNLARTNKEDTNLKHFSEAQRFADDLGSEIIIVHGGSNGSIEETIRQLERFGDDRIVLENKPKVGLLDEECIGWSPDEFKRVMKSGILLSGMALDFVHAACAALSLGIDEMGMIKDFIEFAPRIFHFADGDSSSEKDAHLNLGKGDLDIAGFLSVIPDGALVTIETPRADTNGLGDFTSDIRFLQQMLSEESE